MAKFSQFKPYKNLNERASEEDIRGKYDEFKDMSKEQLNEELLKEVARQKDIGTFDYNALASMVGSLQKVLPERDYENIRRMLESLK